MSVFNDNATPAEKAASNVSKRVNNLYAHVLREFEGVFRSIWSNPNATPQELFAEFGTQGVKLFALSNKVIELANTADPSNPLVIQIPYEYEINQDGSVTIGDLIVAEEETPEE